VLFFVIKVSGAMLMGDERWQELRVQKRSFWAMALVFLVKVTPRSGRVAWSLDKAGRLKCALKSAPERGEANQELIKLIARALKVSAQDVQIISGATSRDKLIKVPLEITFEALLTMLGIEKQMSLV
jgi:uncharacterized protein (TIGR00251 family)